MNDLSPLTLPTASWNPVLGCMPVSKGCEQCRAVRYARRFAAHNQRYEGLTRVTVPGLAWKGGVRPAPQDLDKPTRWLVPRTIAVNPLGDLFHEAVPLRVLAMVFMVIAATPQHTYWLGTRRPERIPEFLDWLSIWHPALYRTWPPPNLWLGLCIEDQLTYDQGLPLLLATPAWGRFIYLNPLLGPINLHSLPQSSPTKKPGEDGANYAYQPHLNCVLAHGERGPHAHPIHPAWVKDLRTQCEQLRVAFHFRGWGAWVPEEFVTYPQHYPACTISPDGEVKAGIVLPGTVLRQTGIRLPATPKRGRRRAVAE
ncbi:putative Phage Gp37/Gp68 family protein [Gammaproteobacteria bacterium]